MAETFGEALAAIRASRPGTTRDSLAQAELARRAGLDHSYISRLEADLRAPSHEVVLLLGRVLAAPPAELDRLLIAAGDLPRDPTSLLSGEPALVEAWRVLHDSGLPERDQAEFRELLGLLVRQFTRRRAA
jgi:transcriptional regulator with XRE-family HTH domain